MFVGAALCCPSSVGCRSPIPVAAALGRCGVFTSWGGCGASTATRREPGWSPASHPGAKLRWLQIQANAISNCLKGSWSFSRSDTRIAPRFPRWVWVAVTVFGTHTRWWCSLAVSRQACGAGEPAHLCVCARISAGYLLYPAVC